MKKIPFKLPEFIANNRLIKALLVMVIIVVVISVVMEIGKVTQEIKPETLPRPSLPPSVQYEQKLLYTFRGDYPEFKESIKVYKIDGSPILTEQKAQNLAVTFGFEDVPKISPDIRGNIYRFKKEETTLQAYSNPVRLEYSNGSEHAPTARSATGVKLSDWTSDFISLENVIGSKFNLENPTITPIVIDEHGYFAEADAFSEADLVKLMSNISIDDIPIINRDRKNYPVEVIIELDGFVRKATVSLFSESISSLGTVKLTNPVDALSAINAGEGVISHLNDPKEAYTHLLPSEISVATLGRVELIYIYDEDDLILHPYYKFSGFAVKKDGTNIEVEVLITAVPLEFFVQ